MAALDQNTLKEKMHQIPEWHIDGKTITREFELDDFRGALDFVNQVGNEAEKADHHPDILIHGWNKVKIILTTHSEGGITEKDIEMAKTVNEFEL